MIFLANENFPSRSIAHIQSAGFEVVNVMKGSSDEEVIAIARDKALVILTMDKDYGLLVFRNKIPDPPAIVFFRYSN